MRFIDHPEDFEAKDLLDENGQPVMDPESGDIQTGKGGKPMIDSDTGRPMRVPGTQQPKKDPRGMVPQPAKKADSLMKQKADIRIHGSANWKKGRNTGGIGAGSDGQIIPRGQFEPMGQIKVWKPDPVLGETVGKTVEEQK